MTVNSHLFLDTLEQMRELLSSPDIESRAHDEVVTKAIAEFYALIDEYAVAQTDDFKIAENSEKIKQVLDELVVKIDIIDRHVNSNINKLNFLSKVTPKN